MKRNFCEFADYSKEQTFRNDFSFMKFIKENENSDYYLFEELFDITTEIDDAYLEGEFLYSEIGNVNNDNEINPVLLNFDERVNDIKNEPLYKKIEGGNIIKCAVNDILISKIRPNLNKVLFINDTSVEIYFTSAFISIRARVIPKIMYYALKSIFHKELVSVARQGKGYPTISERDLRYLRFNKASIDYLIDNSKEIEEMINDIERKISKQKGRKHDEQYYIDNVFQKYFNFNTDIFDSLKKDNFYMANFSNLHKERDLRFGVRFHRTSGNFVENELSRITEKRIKDYITVPIMTGKSISPQDYDENGSVGYVSMADISSWYFNYEKIRCVNNQYLIKNSSKRPRGEKESYSLYLQAGDILMIRSGEGSIGKVAYLEESIDAVFSDFIIRIRLTNYNSLFAYYYFRTTYFQYLIEVYKKGLGNNTNIFPAVLQNFPLPELKLAEQDKISNEIKKQFNKNLDSQKLIEEYNLEIFGLLKQSL